MSGVRFAEWNENSVINFVCNAVRSSMENACIMLIEAIKQSMNEPKSGIKYSNLPRRSSAPGESPAIQTGRLADSLEYKIFEERNSIIARVGVNVEKDFKEGVATYLEFGTNKMKARPYLRRTAFLKEDEIIKILAQI